MEHIQIKNNLNESELADLKMRWEATALTLNIPLTAAEGIYDQLCFEYSAWTRSYHNLSHIWSLLQFVELYAEELESKALFEMAIWFHDYIYDAQKKDNEAQSAYWAEELLHPYLNKKQLHYIKELILSTIGHKPRLKDNSDQTWFLDFDLAVLASDRTTYKAYADAIREEYKSWYSYFVYNFGRKKVMKKFLKRKQLYYSSTFKENYEAIARENVKWEIRGLKEG